MAGKFNGEKLKTFLYRRRSNTIGLMLITALSIALTLICAFIGFKRTNVLAGVCVLLGLLCAVQYLRVRRSYRTIHAFKGTRKRKKKEA